jgi:hypothetical protein
MEIVRVNFQQKKRARLKRTLAVPVFFFSPSNPDDEAMTFTFQNGSRRKGNIFPGAGRCN